MSLFKNLFGKSDPVAELGKQHARGEWAALLAAAKRLERAELSPEVLAQVAAWEDEAGDRLARAQSRRRRRGCCAWGICSRPASICNWRRQARPAESAGSGPKGGWPALTAGNRAIGARTVETAAACGSGCGPTCAAGMPAGGEADELDAPAAWNCCWRRCPSELAGHYAAAGAAFLQAWLAAQEGEDAQALALFERVPATQRGPLFRAERGVVLARNRQPAGRRGRPARGPGGTSRAVPSLRCPGDACWP